MRSGFLISASCRMAIPRSVPFDICDHRPGEGELHQILAPDDFAGEHLLNLVNDLLAYARLIDLPEQVSEHQRLYAGTLRGECVVLVVAARRAVRRARRSAAEVV